MLFFSFAFDFISVGGSVQESFLGSSRKKDRKKTEGKKIDCYPADGSDDKTAQEKRNKDFPAHVEYSQELVLDVPEFQMSHGMGNIFKKI